MKIWTKLIQKIPEKIPKKKLKEKIKKVKHTVSPSQYESQDEKYLSLGDHLEELRYRLLAILGVLFLFTILSFIFNERLHAFFLAPFHSISDEELILNNVYGGLEVLFKMSFMTAFVIGFPICIHILWGFFTPAFSKKASILGHVVFAFATLLFWTGLIVTWTYVFPISLQFLFIDTLPKGVAALTSVENYYSFLFLIHLASGVSFQLPLVFVGGGVTGIITMRWHLKYWKFIILVLLAFSAIITPPDPMSLCILAGILIALYCSSVLVTYIIERIRLKKAQKS